MVESERLSACRASATNATSNAGSASAEKNTSRLAPMPSKLDPVSSAATTVKNRITPSKPAKSRKSAGNAISAGKCPNGISMAAVNHRRQPQHRPGAEQPRGRAAVNRAFLQQLPQIKIGLQQRRAASPGKERLRAVDDAEQQWRQPQRQQQWNKRGRVHGQRNFQTSSTINVTAMYRT